MRFTPTQSSQLIKAKVFSYIKTGSPSQCNLYVYDDQNGKPGTQRFQTTYMPIHNTWQEIPITSTITYNTDFWIAIKIPSASASSEVWLVSDNGVNYPTRNATKASSTSSWKVPSDRLKGDLCIRAIVTYTGVEEEELLPSNEIVTLGQNYPNPVVYGTTISYVLPKEMKVELKIYDCTGRAVRTLVDEVQTPGQKRVLWDRKNESGETVPSGMYFYKLHTGDGNPYIKAVAVL